MTLDLPQVPTEHTDPIYEQAWVGLSKQVRSKMGISPTYSPWTSTGKLLTGVPKSKRMLDAMNIAWASRPVPERTLPVYMDLPQCVRRKTWGPAVPCLTRSTILYDFASDQVVPTAGLLALLGFPVSDLDLSGLSESDLADLTGEGFFLPCVGAILASIFLNPAGPWWHEAS